MYLNIFLYSRNIPMRIANINKNYCLYPNGVTSWTAFRQLISWQIISYCDLTI